MKLLLQFLSLRSAEFVTSSRSLNGTLFQAHFSMYSDDDSDIWVLRLDSFVRVLPGKFARMWGLVFC